MFHRKYKKSLVRHLLNSAKALIPLKWKTRHTPSIKDWLLKTDTIYEMEETMAIKKDFPHYFIKCGDPGTSLNYLRTTKH